MQSDLCRLCYYRLDRNSISIYFLLQAGTMGDYMMRKGWQYSQFSVVLLNRRATLT